MLKNKTAIITGGARGIGAAIAEKLASLGADVAIIYASSAAQAEALTARLSEQYGVRARAWRCDVSDFEAAGKCVSEIKEALGRVDILVNNAGIRRDKLVLMMKEADFDDVVAANLKGTFNMIRHCAPLFLRQHSGKIINISSVAGVTGNAGQANYAASKAGVIGLTKSVARELGSRGITCNAIAPGFIQTDMTREFDESNPMVAGIPLKRMGTPADVAEAAAFLAGSGADYITGIVLPVDGGIAT